jgi:hypothetical protein
VATATSQLSRELGGTVGVAIMGAIMSSMMMNKLTAAMPAQPAAADGKMMDPAAGAALEELQDPQVLMDIDKLDTMRASLPEQMQGFFDSFVATIREALSYSLTGVFLFSAIMVAVAVVFTLFLKEIPLRTTNEEPEDEQAG